MLRSITRVLKHRTVTLSRNGILPGVHHNISPATAALDDVAIVRSIHATVSVVHMIWSLKAQHAHDPTPVVSRHGDATVSTVHPADGLLNTVTSIQTL